MQTAGSLDHYLENNQVYLRVMMSLNFNILDKSIQSMALMVDSISRGNEKIDINKPYFKKNLANMADTAALRKYYSELSDVEGKPVLPDELSTTIFLQDVKLVWDDTSNSYRSRGRIGIGYINKRPINRYVEGYVEVWRKRTGDIFDLYLRINDNLYYYFGYTRGNMQVLSSDNTGFNDPIRILKEKLRTTKTKRGKTPYSYLISTSRKFQAVAQRWMSIREPGKQQEPLDLQQDNQEQPANEVPLEEKPKE